MDPSGTTGVTGAPAEKHGGPMSEQLEVGTPAPAAHRRNGLRTGLIAGVTAVVVGGAAFGGWQLQQFLAGGGPQPEDVLPASTVAFASIDLDPGAGQKLAAYQLLKKFPDAHVTDQTDLKQKAWDALDDSSVAHLDYAKDVKPWLGDRFAIAAVPAPGTDDGLTPLGVVQVTDADAAAKAFRHIAGANQHPAKPDFFWAFEDGYALIADDQSELDAIVAADQHLADSATFRHDRDSLGGDQVAMAWTDLGAAWSAAPADARKDLTREWGKQVNPAGSLVAGISLTSRSVDLTGHGFGVSTGGAGASAGLTPGTGLVETLPADSDVVVGLTGLGPALAKAWDTYGENGDPFGLGQQADALGLRLPGDLQALFGSELAVGATLAGDQVHVTATAISPDAQRGAEVWNTGASMLSSRDYPAKATGDRWIATDRSSTGATLGSNDLFRSVVPDVGRANAVLFVDIPAVEDTMGSMGPGGTTESESNPMRAVGFSVTGTQQQVDLSGHLLLKD